MKAHRLTTVGIGISPAVHLTTSHQGRTLVTMVAVAVLTLGLMRYPSIALADQTSPYQEESAEDYADVRLPSTAIGSAGVTASHGGFIPLNPRGITVRPGEPSPILVSSQIKCERELAIREWCKFVMIRMHLPKSRHLDLPSTAEDELLQCLHRVRHFAQR